MAVCVYRYVIWYDRGYQEFDKVVSATMTKVKGIAVTNYTELNITVPGGVDGIRIWDVADYVVPPQVMMMMMMMMTSSVFDSFNP